MSNMNKYLPLSGREFPRFSAIKTFFRLPNVVMTDDFDIALFGIPFDGAVSYRPGARFGPSAVREATSLGRGFHWGRGLSLFEKLKFADIGDCPTVPIDQAQTYKRIEKFVTSLSTAKKKFLAVGGDHSITLPILRSLKKMYGQPLNFIHFDAHLDTYPAAWGCEYHHGAFARHAVEEGLVNPKSMVQIGVRGPLAGESDLDFSKKHGITLITIDDLKSNDVDKIIKKLPDFSKGPTYISFDIDCLDPAFAPGTGTPVVGGLSTYEVQQILRRLKIQNLIGGDLVEISPAYDQSQITALAGADALFEMMCLFNKFL